MGAQTPSPHPTSRTVDLPESILDTNLNRDRTKPTCFGSVNNEKDVQGPRVINWNQIDPELHHYEVPKKISPQNIPKF